MANGPYASTSSTSGGFLKAEIDWDDGDWVLIGCGEGYTYDIAHDVVDDLTDVLDTDTMVTAVVDGWADADDNSLTVATGDTLRHLIIAEAGDTATAKLILHMDTNSNGTAINRPGNDSAFPVRWPTQGIFRIR